MVVGQLAWAAVQGADPAAAAAAAAAAVVVGQLHHQRHLQL